MSEYRVVEYNEQMICEWDEFVLEKSINGTFLQTRNFLNYHPNGRFVDASLMVYDKNRLIAVMPACVVESDECKELFSHKGSTFGGIVIKKDYYQAEKVIRIVSKLEEFFQKHYSRVTLKITADLFSVQNGDLLKYVLNYLGYDSYGELSTYVDLKEVPEDIISYFDRNKLRNIQKCEENNLEFKELNTDEEIRDFYSLLEINLSKYGTKPIHTFEEIISFRNSRIPNNVKFYGVFKDGVELAGGMLFKFEQANVLHAQNLSADYRFTEYSPITYLYYKVIQQAKLEGYRALSWGISTEDKGKVLNLGLIRNKESYGSKHQINMTFVKEYSGA